VFTGCLVTASNNVLFFVLTFLPAGDCLTTHSEAGGRLFTVTVEWKYSFSEINTTAIFREEEMLENLKKNGQISIQPRNSPRGPAVNSIEE
jgi:hypothetical protein